MILSTALWRPTSSAARSTCPSRSVSAAAWTPPVASKVRCAARSAIGSWPTMAGDTVQRPATEAARVRSDSMVRRPHNPQAAVVITCRRSPSRTRQPIHRLAGDRHVEHVAARLGLDVEAVLDRADLGAVADHVFGQQEPGGEGEILARRAHDHREGRAVDAHLHRLLDGDRVAIGLGRGCRGAARRRRRARRAPPPEARTAIGDRRSRPRRLGRPGAAAGPTSRSSSMTMSCSGVGLTRN